MIQISRVVIQTPKFCLHIQTYKKEGVEGFTENA